jgi:HEAT repeat protein
MAVDEDKDVRKTTYFVLGEIGDKRGLIALDHGLTDDVPEVRWNAAMSLTRFNDRRAIPVLREMLDRARLNEVRDMREDQKEDAMIMAMAPYARLAGADARPDLQRISATDASLRVRAEAKSALQSLR